MVGPLAFQMNNSLYIKFKTINMDSNNCIYDQDFTDRNLKSINIFFIIIFPVLSLHKSILFCNELKIKYQIFIWTCILQPTEVSLNPESVYFLPFILQLHLIHENHLKYVNVKQFLWKKVS